MIPGGARRLLLLALFLTVSCGQEGADWSEEDFVAIYTIALGAVREEFGVTDTLFVDPRSRFLVEVGLRAVQMGDFNRYGDPDLSAAIRRSPSLAACVRDPSGDCSHAYHDAFAVISEVLPLSRHEALLIASHVVVDDGNLSPQELFVHLRFRNQEWMVSRLREGR